MTTYISQIRPYKGQKDPVNMLPPDNKCPISLTEYESNIGKSWLITQCCTPKIYQRLYLINALLIS